MLAASGAANTSGKSVTTLIVSIAVLDRHQLVAPRLDRLARLHAVHIDRGGVGPRVVVADRRYEPPVSREPLVRHDDAVVRLSFAPDAPQPNPSRHPLRPQ